MAPKYGKLAIGQILPDRRQPRQAFDEAALLALGQNMLAFTQQVPVIVYMAEGQAVLLDGERRWRAAKLVGIAELWVLMLASRPSAAELAILQTSLDVHRESLSLMERSNVLSKIQAETGWTVTEIGERLSLSQGMVSKLLAFQRLAPAIQGLLQTGGLDGEKATVISRELDHARQLELVKEAAHLSREQIRAKVKRKPAGGAAVKRAAFALSSDTTVSVTGPEMTLADVIEKLLAMVGELKRGLKQHLDIITVQRVLAQKAKVRS
jgi:ParB family chromosome partitioning protein